MNDIAEVSRGTRFDFSRAKPIRRFIVSPSHRLQPGDYIRINGSVGWVQDVERDYIWYEPLGWVRAGLVRLRWFLMGSNRH